MAYIRPIMTTAAFPQYAYEITRRRSFEDWPRALKQTPQQLSDAGFFYSGRGDRVVCFSCGGHLRQWEEKDDPWTEHAFWYKDCQYLKLVKGSKFYTEVIDKMIRDRVEKKRKLKQSSDDNSDDDDDDDDHDNDAGASTSRDNSNTDAIVQEMVRARIDEKKNATSVSKNDDEDTSTSPLDDEKLCKICFSSEFNTVFAPCGHIVACAKCAASIMKCPLCQEIFHHIIRIYFS